MNFTQCFLYALDMLRKNYLSNFCLLGQPNNSKFVLF